MARTPTAPADAPTVIAQAERDQVDALAASVAHWQDEADQVRRQLLEHQSSAGARVLDDELSPQDVAAEAASLHGQLATAEAARDEAQRRVELARKATLLAIAGDLAAEADKTRDLLTAHEAKLRPLLDQLAELEGRCFRPLTDYEEAERIDRANGGTGRYEGVPFELSRTGQLERAIADLERRAGQVRDRARDGMDDAAYRKALTYADGIAEDAAEMAAG